MIKLWIAYLTVGLLPMVTWAIPMPKSKSLAQQHRGYFQSRYGFAIHADNTEWRLHRPNKKHPYIARVYRAPNKNKGVQAALTVRVDQLDKPMTLKAYSMQWLKDYPRFGLDVLANKPVRVGQQIGYLIDMINREGHKQLRQVLFVKDRRVVILTCRDHKDTFRESLDQCNQIIKNFSWTQRS